MHGNETILRRKPSTLERGLKKKKEKRKRLEKGDMATAIVWIHIPLIDLKLIVLKFLKCLF